MAASARTATLLAAVALGALAATGARAQITADPLPNETLRLVPLDTGQQRLDVREPDEVRDPGRIIEASPQDEGAGEAGFELAPLPEPAEPALDFDLFEGPPAGPAQPQGRAAPETAGERALPSGRAADAQARPATLPFRATGPVRSPTFAPAGAEERINRAVGGLRPSFPVTDEEPFAPDGIRVSRVRLLPVLEQEVGVSDNLDEDTTKASGAFSQTRLSVQVLTDWARHQTELNASATYRRNFGGEVKEDPRFALDGRLQLDLASQTTATLRGALSYAREDPIRADPLLSASVRPEVLAYSFGADVARPFGRAELSASGDVVREEREFGGQFRSNDFTTASVGLRAGYDIGTALQPFVGGSFGRRVFDEREEISALDLDSDIVALRGGLAFDFGEKLSGEAALGYAWNDPSHGTLPRLGAPTLDLAVNWSPRRGTDVLLTGTTFFDPEQSNLSTSTVYEAALGVRHRATARADLTGRLSAAYRDRDAAGSIDDVTYAAEAGVTYWLNRGLALTALARHLQLKSDLEEAEYSANSIRVGVRIQR